MIVTEFPEPAQRAKAMSAYIFVAVGGGSIGLLVGGLVTEAVNWHWIFFINIPVGVVTLLLGRALLEESQGIGLDKGVDWLGSITVTAALMLAIYAIVSTPDHGWGSAHTLFYGGAAIVLLGVFLLLQARLANPIMPLRILRVPGLASTSIVRGLLASGLFSTFFLGAHCLTGGYELAFLVGAACVALGAVLAYFLLRTPPPPRVPASEAAPRTGSRRVVAPES